MLAVEVIVFVKYCFTTTNVLKYYSMSKLFYGYSIMYVLL